MGVPTVLSYTNALPSIPFPNHSSGQSKPQSFRYPGAVQPQAILPTVLSYTNALPSIPFPNHSSGQSKPQSFIFPGAVQPLPTNPTPPTPPNQGILGFASSEF